jgi:hypothetical protein
MPQPGIQREELTQGSDPRKANVSAQALIALTGDS